MTKVSALLAPVGFTPLGASDAEVTGIAYRSDKVQPGDVFFCIPGTATDGHLYAPDAVARGAAALVVTHPLPELDVPQFQVEDARAALALASDVLFGHPSAQMRVVGVTGTNGKTTTAYLTEWIARQEGHVTGLVGTVETRVAGERLASDRTTPESYELQRLFGEMVGRGVGTCAIEVSSHAIDLKRVYGTRFAVVAFTNLTQDHLDYHKTMENYFRVKERLFTEYEAGARVVCIDDEYGRRIVDDCRRVGRPCLTVGLPEDAMVTAEDVRYSATGTELTVSYNLPQGVCTCAPLAGKVPVHLHLIGRFNVENALVAFGIGLALGAAPEDIAEALHTIPQVPGRLERVRAAEKRGFACLVDYAHTPDAIDKALSCVKAVTPGRTIIVFGCGGDRDATKRPKMGRSALAADYAIVTSDNPRTEDPDAIIADILPGMAGGEDRYEVVADRRAAIRRALALAQPGDTVLIAGKGHEDYQIVGTEKHHFDDREVAAEELEA